MANKPQLSLQDIYPYLTNQTGFTGQESNPLESMLSGVGPSATSGITAFSNPSAIGADNTQLASQSQNSTNAIFSLVQQHIQKANQRAAEKAARLAQEEAEKKAAALQAKLLESQKKAALNALKNTSKLTNNGGGGVGGLGGNSFPLTPMPSLPINNNVKAPKLPVIPDMNSLKLPRAVPPKLKKTTKRDPRKPGIQN